MIVAAFGKTTTFFDFLTFSIPARRYRTYFNNNCNITAHFIRNTALSIMSYCHHLYFLSAVSFPFLSCLYFHLLHCILLFGSIIILLLSLENFARHCCTSKMYGFSENTILFAELELLVINRSLMQGQLTSLWRRGKSNPGAQGKGGPRKKCC